MQLLYASFTSFMRYLLLLGIISINKPYCFRYYILRIAFTCFHILNFIFLHSLLFLFVTLKCSGFSCLSFPHEFRYSLLLRIYFYFAVIFMINYFVFFLLLLRLLNFTRPFYSWVTSTR